MTIEVIGIVDFPIDGMVSFHSYVELLEGMCSGNKLPNSHSIESCLVDRDSSIDSIGL